ncbi:hypothetical protein CEN44_00405 [Fischerella muscicola CCMEE 5323]|uniref:Uncharacterized protein n=1 Tax=Fischerella muscicola CCMEE 5323 TaxID=2019572 RepID=A0A2N6K997_FISMU|nr:hypothetical protein [Fischerella sp. FACHB-380]PLZ94548.1 hypothetical protein CEN44_00405 [Fischerella muscicola CCMEE 5323]
MTAIHGLVYALVQSDVITNINQFIDNTKTFVQNIVIFLINIKTFAQTLVTVIRNIKTVVINVEAIAPSTNCHLQTQRNYSLISDFARVKKQKYMC